MFNPRLSYNFKFSLCNTYFFLSFKFGISFATSEFARVILSGARGYSLWGSGIFLESFKWTSIIQEVLLQLFSSSSLIHLNPLVGKGLLIAQPYKLLASR